MRVLIDFFTLKLKKSLRYTIIGICSRIFTEEKTLHVIFERRRIEYVPKHTVFICFYRLL